MATKTKKTGKTKAAKKTKPISKKITAVKKKPKTTKPAAKKKSRPAAKSAGLAKKKAPAKIAKKSTKAAPAKKKISKPKTAAKKITKKPAKPAMAVKPVKKAVPVQKAKVEKKPAVKKAAPKLKVIKNEYDFQPRPEGSLPSYLVGLDIAPYHEKSGEEYMNDNQQDHFRNILNKWKQQLLQEMNRTVHHLQDEAINLPDPNDRASQEEEFSLELRARDRERKLIKKIEETFQKIEEGNYGYCDSCGVEIGIRRLEARPTANLCIDCKTLDEIRERQMGG